jgi:hypothetical protein
MYLVNGSGPVGDPFGPCHACTVSAAVKVTVRFDAVPDHLHTAILASGSQSVDSALEAVEGARLVPRHTHLKSLVVVVATDFTSGHSSTPFLRLPFVDHARCRRIAICQRCGGGSRKGVSRTALPQTSHDVSIYVFAVAICESSVGSLYLELELLVEGYDGRIVRVYRRSNLVRFNQLSARLRQASINAVLTSLPCQPSCTAIPKCPTCRVLGFM